MKKIISFFNLSRTFIVIIFLSLLTFFVLYRADKPYHDTQKERENQYIQEVNKKQAEIKRLRALYDSISLRMYNDSLEFAERLRIKTIEIKRLKQNAAKVDFKNANPAELDSVVNGLYPKPRR